MDIWGTLLNVEDSNITREIKQNFFKHKKCHRWTDVCSHSIKTFLPMKAVLNGIMNKMFIYILG